MCNGPVSFVIDRTRPCSPVKNRARCRSPGFSLALNAHSRSTQAGLLSVLSSVFITNVESKFELDSNGITTTYVRIFTHALRGSPFTSANPDSVTCTGPPPRDRNGQTFTSREFRDLAFLPVFLVALGKQLVNRYLRNQEGPAAE